MPEPAGEVAVIEVSELTCNWWRRFPEVTAVAPVKLVPVMLTLVPPAVGPAVGLMEVTDGTEVGELICRRGRRGSTGVVTVTSTVPVPAGEVAVMEVAESAVIVAALEPKSTAVAADEVRPGDGHTGATGRSGRRWG